MLHAITIRPASMMETHWQKNDGNILSVIRSLGGANSSHKQNHTDENVLLVLRVRPFLHQRDDIDGFCRCSLWGINVPPKYWSKVMSSTPIEDFGRCSLPTFQLPSQCLFISLLREHFRQWIRTTVALFNSNTNYLRETPTEIGEIYW